MSAETSTTLVCSHVFFHYQSQALLCTFSIVNTAVHTKQIGLQRTVVMAGSGTPTSGREPPKQSNNRKAAEGDERDEENNATKRFKEERLQKDKRLRLKKRKNGGHSVDKNNIRNTTKDNEWRTASSRAKLEE